MTRGNLSHLNATAAPLLQRVADSEVPIKFTDSLTDMEQSTEALRRQKEVWELQCFAQKLPAAATETVLLRLFYWSEVRAQTCCITSNTDRSQTERLTDGGADSCPIGRFGCVSSHTTELHPSLAPPTKPLGRPTFLFLLCPLILTTNHAIRRPCEQKRRGADTAEPGKDPNTSLSNGSLRARHDQTHRQSARWLPRPSTPS